MAPGLLTVAQVDLGELVVARGNTSYEMSWWIDPATGALHVFSADTGIDGTETGDPEEQEWVGVDRAGSREAYQDMVDFAEVVADPRARDLLLRALDGRGAFRRFRDTLFDLGDLRQHWFAFSDACEQARVIEWLIDSELVDADDAERERRARLRSADDVLAVVGRPVGGVAVEDVPSRWEEVVRRLVAGQSVHLLRDGRPFAVIEPLH